MGEGGRTTLYRRARERERQRESADAKRALTTSLNGHSFGTVCARPVESGTRWGEVGEGGGGKGAPSRNGVPARLVRLSAAGAGHVIGSAGQWGGPAGGPRRVTHRRPTGTPQRDRAPLSNACRTVWCSLSSAHAHCDRRPTFR